MADSPGEGADLMLFGSNLDSGLASRANDGFGVDRLQGVEVQDARFIAELFLEDVGGPHSLGNHGPAGNEGEVFVLIGVGRCQNGFEGIEEDWPFVAKADRIGLSEDERRLVIGDDGGRFTGEADIFWSFCCSSR